MYHVCIMYVYVTQFFPPVLLVRGLSAELRPRAQHQQDRGKEFFSSSSSSSSSSCSCSSSSSSSSSSNSEVVGRVVNQAYPTCELVQYGIEYPLFSTILLPNHKYHQAYLGRNALSYVAIQATSLLFYE